MSWQEAFERLTSNGTVYTGGYPPFDTAARSLNQHRWCVPGFVAGVAIFGASFLLGMKVDQRLVETRFGRIDDRTKRRYRFLGIICDAGLLVGGFLMLIWPHIA